MSLLSSQRYRSRGRRLGIDPTTLERAIATIERIQRSDPRLTPVLTLRHLSELTGAPYGYLRRVVGRILGGYRHVHLRKRIPGRSRRRVISIPPKRLLQVQQWIAQNILRFSEPSRASFAYHPNSSPVLAAEEHCGCEWLLKVDIEDFFHSITEGRVSAMFYRLGYPRLLAFELARLTTMPLFKEALQRDPVTRWLTIPYYHSEYEGVLPQGPPQVLCCRISSCASWMKGSSNSRHSTGCAILDMQTILPFPAEKDPIDPMSSGSNDSCCLSSRARVSIPIYEKR